MVLALAQHLADHLGERRRLDEGQLDGGALRRDARCRAADAGATVGGEAGDDAGGVLSGIGDPSPPSTRKRPAISTGENTPGIDALARSARASGPESRSTRSPVARSVATTTKGRSRSLKLRPPTRSSR